MTFLFDHLISILVGATLLGALLFVQMRQQQQNAETILRDNVQMQTADFLEILQRDIENIRTRAQAEAAFGAYRFTLRRATGTDGETYTSQVSFPTLKNPALGAASPVVMVTYQMTPTGSTVRLGSAMRPTYRATRTVYSRADGTRVTGGGENLVDLDVIFVAANGAEITQQGGTYSGTSIPAGGEIGAAGTPVRAKVSAVAASTPVARRASDQRNTSSLNGTRHADTVRIVSATASGGAPTPETGAGGIPPLPGDPTAPPAPPPAPPAGPGPSPSPTPPSSPSGPSGPSTPAPGPPPRPTPPAGTQI